MKSFPKVGLIMSCVEAMLILCYYQLDFPFQPPLWMVLIFHVIAGIDFALFSYWRNGFSLVIGIQRQLLGKKGNLVVQLIGLLCWLTCWPVLVLTYIGSVAEYISAGFVLLLMFFKKTPKI